MLGYDTPPVLPGNSVLGGAAAGLTYEGALHDAAAAEDRDRRREAGRRRPVPPAQTQSVPPGRRGVGTDSVQQ